MSDEQANDTSYGQMQYDEMVAAFKYKPVIPELPAVKPVDAELPVLIYCIACRDNTRQTREGYFRGPLELPLEVYVCKCGERRVYGNVMLENGQDRVVAPIKNWSWLRDPS